MGNQAKFSLCRTNRRRKDGRLPGERGRGRWSGESGRGGGTVPGVAERGNPGAGPPPAPRLRLQPRTGRPEPEPAPRPSPSPPSSARRRTREVVTHTRLLLVLLTLTLALRLTPRPLVRTQCITRHCVAFFFVLRFASSCFVSFVMRFVFFSKFVFVFFC